MRLQEDTQAWTGELKLGREEEETVGTATEAPLCSPLCRWVWGSVVRCFWTLKKTKRGTKNWQYPGDFSSTSSHRLTALLPSNQTAPDLSTTSLQMWWKNLLQLWCTLKSWAGELTREVPLTVINVSEFFFLCLRVTYSVMFLNQDFRQLWEHTLELNTQSQKLILLARTCTRKHEKRVLFVCLFLFCFVYYRCNRKGPKAFVILFLKNIISCWYTLAVDSLVFISKWNQVKSWQSIPTFTFCVTITFYCVCLTWATVLIKEICFYLFSVQSFYLTFFLKSFSFFFLLLVKLRNANWWSWSKIKKALNSLEE